MGVNTKSFDNASDMITFSRASGAYGLTKVSYGSELVTNGTFDTDVSGWTASTANVSLASVGGQFELTNNGVGAAYQSFTTVVGATYKLEFDYITRNGSGQFRVGTVIGAFEYAIASSVGQRTVYFVATTTTTFISMFDNAGGAGVVNIFDNVSVKEVTYNSSAADATLQLTYHPNDVPRIEYNTDGTAKGLLVEEARTNLITYSEFTGGWAGKTQITLSPNSVTSPTGNQDGALVTSSGIDPYAFNFTSVSAGNDYTFTVWLKGVGNTVGRAPKVWMLNNSATMTSVVADTTPLSSEWQRYTATATCTVSGTTLARIDFDNSGLSVSGEQVQVFGAQFEAGSFPTSYIKTTGATATRSADIASIPVADFGYNYTNTVGTFLVDWNTFSTGTGRVFVATSLSSATGNRAVDMNFDISSSRFDVYSNHTGGDLYQLGAPSSVGNKVAAAMKENNSAAVLNGGTVKTDTATGTPITATHFHFGLYGSSYLNGHIKSIKYYPRRLTNAQLQELTT